MGQFSKITMVTTEASQAFVEEKKSASDLVVESSFEAENSGEGFSDEHSEDENSGNENSDDEDSEEEDLEEKEVEEEEEEIFEEVVVSVINQDKKTDNGELTTENN